MVRMMMIKITEDVMFVLKSMMMSESKLTCLADDVMDGSPLLPAVEAPRR